MAIEQDNRRRLAELLAADPKLSQCQNSQGMPALMWAIYLHRWPLVEMLLERGAELDLFGAAALGRLEKLRAADKIALTTFSGDGWAPLHLAAHFGRAEAAVLLLDGGAEVDTRSRNPQSYTPLHAAATGHQTGICELLLGRGAQVNSTDAAGFTPLHLAAHNGDLPLAQILLNHGADPNARTREWTTPLTLAQNRGYWQMIALLQEFGAGASIEVTPEDLIEIPYPDEAP